MTTLLRYRQRPVAWGWLAGLAAGWLLGVRALAGLPEDPGTGVTVVRLAAFLLGVSGAVLAARRPTRRATSCGRRPPHAGGPWPSAWPGGWRSGRRPSSP